MIAAKYKIQAKIAKALAHESRLMILDALKDGEMCVCELVVLVGADQSTISKHLSIMREAGLVEDRKEGNRVFYRLRSPGLLSFLAYAQDLIRGKIQNLSRAGM